MSSPPTRLRLTRDFLQYAWAAAAVTPGTLLSVARGRLEPDIPEGSDFGCMRTQTHTVAHADSVEQLQQLLAQAYARRQPVTCTGSRHSANGQTLPPRDGLQIRLNRDSGQWTAPTMVDETHVTLSAAHTWRTLQGFLKPLGRSCTVLTDHLTTTVGGTLSVGGGIGTSSVAFGRQLDSVTRFSLVLPTGELRWCSPDENPGLFRHAMGGMGSLGVIDQVTLRTRPLVPWLAIHRFQARTLAEAVGLVRQVLEHPRRPETLKHLVLEGPIMDTPFIQFELGFEFGEKSQARACLRSPPEPLVALQPHRRALFARALVKSDQSNDRHNRSATYVSSLLNHKHLWNDYFFADFDAYQAFLRFAREQVFAKYGTRYLMSGLAFAYPGDPQDPVHPDHRRAAFSFPHKTPTSDWRWSFGFNYSVPDGPEVAPTVAALTALREEATRLGAGVYGYGYDERTRADFDQAYGPIVQDFIALKQEVDPEGLFGSGLPLFG